MSRILSSGPHACHQRPKLSFFTDVRKQLNSPKRSAENGNTRHFQCLWHFREKREMFYSKPFEDESTFMQLDFSRLTEMPNGEHPVDSSCIFNVFNLQLSLWPRSFHQIYRILRERKAQMVPQWCIAKNRHFDEKLSAAEVFFRIPQNHLSKNQNPRKTLNLRAFKGF